MAVEQIAVELELYTWTFHPPPPLPFWHVTALVADASLWIIYHDDSSNDFKYLSSYVSLAQLQVPFINNMVLGRTFDYSKSMVGNDIYSADAQEKISTQNVGKYEHKFEVIGHLKAQSDLGRVEERWSIEGDIKSVFVRRELCQRFLSWNVKWLIFVLWNVTYMT